MSDAQVIANDLSVSAQARRAAVWRRAPPRLTPGGGVIFGRIAGWFLSWNLRFQVRRLARVPAGLTQVSDAELQRALRAGLRTVRRHGAASSALPVLCSLIGETLARYGHEFGRDPAVYLAASRLYRSRILAIEGPERREAALVIAVCAAVLRGERVHLMFESDARAKTFFDTYQGVYRAFSFSAAIVSGDMAAPARRNAYRHQVVHVGAATLGGDYLRDLEVADSDGRRLRAAANKLMMRPEEGARLIAVAATHLFVEETDFVLGNAAARMVTISGEDPIFERSYFAEEAIDFARRLLRGEDFEIDNGAITITTSGFEKADRIASEFSPLWNGAIRREALLSAALEALHLFRPGEHYKIENSVIEPANADFNEIFHRTVCDVEVRSLIEAKEEVLDNRARRVRRAAPIRAIVRGYGVVGGVMRPGASLAGEFWKAFRTPTIDLDRGAENRLLKSVRVVPSKDRADRVIVKAIRKALAEKFGQIWIIARVSDIESLQSAVQSLQSEAAVDLGRVSYLPFREALQFEPAALHAVDQVILATTGALDEEWRRLVEKFWLAPNKPQTDAVFPLDDAIFEDSFPDTLPPSIVKIVTSLFGRAVFLRALSLRRKRFSDYRLAQVAHFQTMDRVLAFSGDASGGA